MAAVVEFEYGDRAGRVDLQELGRPSLDLDDVDFFAGEVEPLLLQVDQDLHRVGREREHVEFH